MCGTIQSALRILPLPAVVPLTVIAFLVNQVSAEVCNEGHVCSAPKQCCALGCSMGCPNKRAVIYSDGPSVTEMVEFMIWNFLWLWLLAIVGLVIAAISCGCWLRNRRRRNSGNDSLTSERGSADSCDPPPHYSRCNSFVQALPPPYNEVTAKPDLYPLVIDYDEGIGKGGTSGFVMRYFRSMSHASTLDSLSSSFMCNVVNEANTIIPPPYSCDNSIDELSGMECQRADTLDVGSIVSLANHRTASDISSLAAQSPCSPPRATSPTIELRELLDKIQQLPHQLPNGHETALSVQRNAQVLCSLNVNSAQAQVRPLSPGDNVGSCRVKRTRGKMYMPLGLPNTRNKAKRWLSRSAPTTPSGTGPISFLAGQSRRSSETENGSQQGVPLLSEQDEMEHNNVDNVVSLLPEHEEDEAVAAAAHQT